MMNNHSNRLWTLLSLVLLALVAGACGGDSDGGGAAANKSDWEEQHGATVRAVSTDVDASDQALTQGDRALILSSCNQLEEDLVDAREALPVPDATVDGSLRAAFDAIDTAGDTCLRGARIANDNHLVEQAQREMKDARSKMDEAERAIENWR